MKSLSSNDILKLQAQLSEGKQEALKQLYDCFSERLLHFCFAIVHQREQAEEVVADVFIQIWQKRARMVDIENFTWYLYVTAKNISLNYLRKNNRSKYIDIDAVSLPYYSIQPEAIDHLINKELLQQINKAINELPPKCRLIFKLVKEDGLKYKEVADLLNINQKTVENQMGIALKKMHTAIKIELPALRIEAKL